MSPSGAEEPLGRERTVRAALKRSSLGGFGVGGGAPPSYHLTLGSPGTLMMQDTHPTVTSPARLMYLHETVNHSGLPPGLHVTVCGAITTCSPHPIPVPPGPHVGSAATLEEQQPPMNNSSTEKPPQLRHSRPEAGTRGKGIVHTNTFGGSPYPVTPKVKPTPLSGGRFRSSHG